MNRRETCGICRSGFPALICSSCKNLLCECCGASHRCHNPKLCKLPFCNLHGQIATHYCSSHMQFLCSECIYVHKDCQYGRLSSIGDDMLYGGYKRRFESLTTKLEKLLPDGCVFNSIDAKEQTLRGSLESAKSKTREVFKALHDSISKREKELIEELDMTYTKYSSYLSDVKRVLTKYRVETATFMDSIRPSTGTERDFITKIKDMNAIMQKDDDLVKKFNSLNVPPRVITVKLDITRLSGDNISKWGKVSCNDTEVPLTEEQFNSLERDKREGKIESVSRSSSSYSLNVAYGNLTKYDVRISNTGRSAWGSKWRIVQVAGERIPDFLSHGFTPRELEVYGSFEMPFYFKFERSGKYKFALVNVGKGGKIKRMSKTLDLIVTVNGGPTRRNRRYHCFPKEKLRPRNSELDMNGTYHFKSRDEIERILKDII